MLQGEIWLAELEAPAGLRPVVILTRSSIIPRLSKITAMPITTNVRDIPTHVVLTQADGMRKHCAATADNIGTFEKPLFLHRLSTLSPARMAQIFAAVRAAFDMPR